MPDQRVVSAISAKGGVGKSTLICLIAQRFQPLDLGIIDADPQGSVANFADAFKVAAKVRRVSNAYQMEEAANDLADCDLVLIDTSGAETPTSMIARKVSDHVLIPTRPGRADIVEAMRVSNLLGEVPHHVVMTQATARSRLVGASLDILRQNHIPILGSMIRRSVAIEEYSWTGRISSKPILGDIESLIAEMVRTNILP